MSEDVLHGFEVAPEAAPTDKELGAPDAGVESLVSADVEGGTDETVNVTDSVVTEPAAKPKLVPLAALHEERERRKELAVKLEETDRRSAAEMGRLQERVNIILQALQQPSESQVSDDPLFIQQFLAANPGVSKSQAEEYFFKEEPSNYLKYKQDQIAKQQAVVMQHTEQQQQVAQAQGQFQGFVTAYKTQATDFAAQNPDFGQAYNYLLHNRDAELRTMGFADPVQRQQILQNEEVGIVQQAFKDRINPAQRLFEIAKFRGYKQQAAAGSAAPATLDQEKKAAAATKSLGSVPGTASTKMNAETLLSMSDEEFAAATRGGKWQEAFK